MRSAVFSFNKLLRFRSISYTIELMTKTIDGVAIPSRFDGALRIPSESELASLGFTDHNPKQWYYSVPLTKSESFNVTIHKAPIAEDGNGRIYGYEELVMDEYFGQPAYFGRMGNDYRHKLTMKLLGVLAHLKKHGVNIAVDPRDYSWYDWPENTPLTGVEADKKKILEIP